MAERSLIVRILGDAKSLIASFKDADSASRAFGAQRVAVVRGIEKEETESLLRLKAKRAQSLGFLRVGAATLGGGAAVFAGIQAFRALAEGLRAAGDEAFTTEGRIRNLGAALATGDIVGGLQALVTQESRLAPDLEKALVALQQMRDEASRVSLEDVLGDTAKFRHEQDLMLAGFQAFGVPLDEATQKTAEWAENLRQATLHALDMETALKAIQGAVPGVLAELEKVTKAMAAARADALQGLSQLPPGIGAAIAREQGPEGSSEGLLKVLRQADANLVKRIEKLRKDGGRDVSEALKRAQEQRNSINAQIKALLAPPPPSSLPTVTATGKDNQADAIRRERERLKRVREEAAKLAAQQRELAKQLEQQRQFRALGLTPGGERQTPTIDNLQKQLKSLTARVAGTKLDTPQTRGLLARIRKVLTDPVHKATEETRDAINGLFETIRTGFEDGGKQTAAGPLTKTSGLNTKKFLEGLGLTPEQEAEARSRLSGLNSAGRQLTGNVPASARGGGFVGGAAPIVVQSTTNLILDGAVIARAVTRSQQKTRRRNPPQKRGPNRIGGV